MKSGEGNLGVNLRFTLSYCEKQLWEAFQRLQEGLGLSSGDGAWQQLQGALWEGRLGTGKSGVWEIHWFAEKWGQPGLWKQRRKKPRSAVCEHVLNPGWPTAFLRLSFLRFTVRERWYINHNLEACQMHLCSCVPRCCGVRCLVLPIELETLSENTCIWVEF